MRFFSTEKTENCTANELRSTRFGTDAQKQQRHRKKNENKLLFPAFSVCDASLHGFYSYIFICRLLIRT